MFLSAPNNHDRFFFFYTFSPPAFDFNVGVTINESHSYRLTSTILKVDVIYDVTMTSTPNILTLELHDLLYNQCIDNTCWYFIFIYPTGRIRVCKVRFVSNGEKRRKSRLVFKNAKTCSCINRFSKPCVIDLLLTQLTDIILIIIWTASSEFGTYRQNLRCSLIQAVSQEEPSDRKPDPWPL